MFTVLCIVLIATLPCVPDMEQPERLAYCTLALGNITPSESFKGAAFVIEPRRKLFQVQFVVIGFHQQFTASSVSLPT